MVERMEYWQCDKCGRFGECWAHLRQGWIMCGECKGKREAGDLLMHQANESLRVASVAVTMADWRMRYMAKTPSERVICEQALRDAKQAQDAALAMRERLLEVAGIA